MEARLGEETGQRKIARLSPRGAGKGKEVDGSEKHLQGETYWDSGCSVAQKPLPD